MKDALFGAPWLKAVARVFDDAGIPLYLVGGAVRNPLMGLPLSDIDVCGPSLPDAVCKACEGTAVRTVLRAPEIGTVELHVTDENGQDQMAEYTAWRTDVYTGGHKPDHVVFTQDITVDAKRRDFSVNALYQRVHADHLEPVADPTGGLDHLKQGILHTVTDDPDEVLRNDGLRLLRAARFQAEMDLVPTPAMRESLQKHAHLAKEIAPERLKEEVQKILMADGRYPMLKRRFSATKSGLETLRQAGLFAVLFPGLAYDEAAVAALAKLAAFGLPVRMAALHSHAEETVLSGVMQRLRFTVRETEEALRVHRAMRETDVLHQAKLGMEALKTAERILEALGIANHLAQTIGHLQSKPLSLKELAVNGSDLKPLFVQQGRPLKEMSAVLEALWRAVLEDKAENTKKALLSRV